MDEFGWPSRLSTGQMDGAQAVSREVAEAKKFVEERIRNPSQSAARDKSSRQIGGEAGRPFGRRQNSSCTGMLADNRDKIKLLKYARLP